LDWPDVTFSRLAISMLDAARLFEFFIRLVKASPAADEQIGKFELGVGDLAFVKLASCSPTRFFRYRSTVRRTCCIDCFLDLLDAKAHRFSF